MCTCFFGSVYIDVFQQSKTLAYLLRFNLRHDIDDVLSARLAIVAMAKSFLYRRKHYVTGIFQENFGMARGGRAISQLGRSPYLACPWHRHCWTIRFFKVILLNRNSGVTPLPPKKKLWTDRQTDGQTDR